MLKAAGAISAGVGLVCAAVSWRSGVSLALALAVAGAAALGLAAIVTYPKDYTLTGQLLGRRVRVDPWSEDFQESMLAARLLAGVGLILLVLAAGVAIIA